MLMHQVCAQAGANHGSSLLSGCVSQLDLASSCLLTHISAENFCRFHSSHALQLVFDWVDVNSPEDLRPGSYSLVTQYPKRQFLPEATDSLADAGLTSKQEAMFIQLS